MTQPQHRCPHLTPNTAEWHAFNVGMLIGNLQSLEFSARVAIATMEVAPLGDLLALQPGQWVQENPMTNYDQLATVLDKFNGRVSSRWQLDVARLVTLRDQLAHGRTAANASIFPLTLLKFGRPAKGMVQVKSRSDMTEAWFNEHRLFLHEALTAVYAGLAEWRSKNTDDRRDRLSARLSRKKHRNRPRRGAEKEEADGSP
jgi:hypothetical protein